MLCKFTTLDGALVFTLTSGVMDADIEPGAFEISVEVPSVPLRRGGYLIDLYVLTSLPQDDLRGAIEFEVAGPRGAVDDPRQLRDYLGVVTVDQQWSEARQTSPSARAPA